jgi:hypothetical protein
MKAPRLFRKKRGGKHYGNWIASIKGEDVNLGSKNAEIANKRLPAALRGKRDFAGDAELAADALEPDVAGAAAPETRPVAQGTTPAGAAAPSTPVLEPELLPPTAPLLLSPAPSNDNARAEAEATNAAAAETSPPAGGAHEDPAAPSMPPEVLEQMLGTLGDTMVELQLQLQGWVIKKRTGKEAGQIPPDASIRKIASQAWAGQFKKWFPDIDDTPPWVLAVGLPLLCVPMQVATATEPEKKPETEQKAAA